LSHAAPFAVLASASIARAAEEAPAEVVAQRPSFFWHVFVSNGIVFGPLMLLLSVALLALVLYILVGLRRRKALGCDLMPRLQEAAGADPQRIAELTRGDRSYLGQAVAAGVERLPHGLEEARHAASVVLQRVRAPRERALRWLMAVAILSPLVGILGTLLGMTLLFMELGRGHVEISQPHLYLGLSHASCVLLEGLFLSSIAVPAYAWLKNRLQFVLLSTGSAADELLTRAHG
jgi:biopolymer transport protein ExbB